MVRTPWVHTERIQAALKGERGIALVAALGFLAVMSLIAIGIVGAYLGRVLDQVEGRPRYLVDRTVNCPPPNAPR